MKVAHMVSIMNKKKRKSISKKIIFFIVLISLSVYVWSPPLYSFMKNKDELEYEKSRQSSLQNQLVTLSKQIKNWEDDQYVIKQARDQLGFIMPGETSFNVIDKTINKKSQKESTQEIPVKKAWFETMISSIKAADNFTPKKTKQKK